MVFVSVVACDEARATRVHSSHADWDVLSLAYEVDLLAATTILCRQWKSVADVLIASNCSHGMLD